MQGIRTMIAVRTATSVSEPRAISIYDMSLRTMQCIPI
jgi:hypothetical protein